MGKFHLLETGSVKPLYAKAFYNYGSIISREKMLGLYKLR